MQKVAITNIEWDTNDQKSRESLPVSVIIENPPLDMIGDVDGHIGVIAEYLADEYEVCVRGFTACVEEDPEMVYFEMRFRFPEEPEEAEIAMCGKGIRAPTVEEANEFYSWDRNGYAGGRPVVDVWPIQRYAAESLFDLSNEDKWPIFGR